MLYAISNILYNKFREYYYNLMSITTKILQFTMKALIGTNFLRKCNNSLFHDCVDIQYIVIIGIFDCDITWIEFSDKKMISIFIRDKGNSAKVILTQRVHFVSSIKDVKVASISDFV